MILLIPYSRFTLVTELSQNQVSGYLEANLQPRNLVSSVFPFFRQKDCKPFEGKFKNGKFHINPVINYQNAFFPVFTGEIQSNKNSTIVTVTMRINGFFFISLIFLILITIQFWNAPYFNPYVFIAFDYLLAITLFNYEANKACHHLEEIFRVNAASGKAD